MPSTWCNLNHMIIELTSDAWRTRLAAHFISLFRGGSTRSSDWIAIVCENNNEKRSMTIPHIGERERSWGKIRVQQIDGSRNLQFGHIVTHEEKSFLTLFHEGAIFRWIDSCCLPTLENKPTKTREGVTDDFIHFNFCHWKTKRRWWCKTKSE